MKRLFYVLVSLILLLTLVSCPDSEIPPKELKIYVTRPTYRDVAVSQMLDWSGNMTVQYKLVPNGVHEGEIVIGEKKNYSEHLTLKRESNSGKYYFIIKEASPIDWLISIKIYQDGKEIFKRDNVIISPVSGLKTISGLEPVISSSIENPKGTIRLTVSSSEQPASLKYKYNFIGEEKDISIESLEGDTGSWTTELTDMPYGVYTFIATYGDESLITDAIKLDSSEADFTLSKDTMIRTLTIKAGTGIKAVDLLTGQLVIDENEEAKVEIYKTTTSFRVRLKDGYEGVNYDNDVFDDVKSIYTGIMEEDEHFYYRVKDLSGEQTDYSVEFSSTPITYTIEYKKGYNGESYTDEELESYTTDTELAKSYTVETDELKIHLNPTRDAYDFLGWTSNDDETPVKEIIIPKGSIGNKTYTAKWKAKTYTISYTLHNGTVTTENPTTYTIESADITLNNPTRDGYEFTGWTGSNGEELSMSVIIYTGNSGNKSYVANWRPLSYYITYNLNEGTVNEPNKTAYTIETEDFTLNNPTRDGYEFTGWTGSNGDVPSTTVTINTGTFGDKEYTANWEAIKYTIVFDSNGGSGNMDSIPAEYDKQITLPANSFTKVGFAFENWKFNDGYYVDEASDLINLTTENGGTVTLSAQWKEGFVLRFDANEKNNVVDGYAYNSSKADFGDSKTYKSVFYDSVVGSLPEPTREGWKFVGWFLFDVVNTGNIGDLVGKIDADTNVSELPTNVLYARWTAGSYSITYDLNGGEVLGNPITYTVETDDIKLNNPTKLGYNFIGWTGTDLDKATETVTIPKGSTGNREYTATWSEPIEYIITYTLGDEEVSNDNPTKYTILTDTIILNNPTRTGYEFIGWTGTNGDTPSTSVTIAEGSTGNREYTANWTQIYSISYELNEGSLAEGESNPESYTEMTETFTLNNPTKDGYTFAGWSENESGGVIYSTVTIEQGSTGDRVYIAHWTSSGGEESGDTP